MHITCRAEDLKMGIIAGTSEPAAKGLNHTAEEVMRELEGRGIEIIRR